MSMAARPTDPSKNLLKALTLLAAMSALGVNAAPAKSQTQSALPGRASSEPGTAKEYNRRLEQLRQIRQPLASAASSEEYRIGPDDLLEISVFEAPELNRSPRVSAGGEISLPLLGPVPSAGLTPRELESVLEELLRRTFMRDPHVSVFVREMQSHPVSVFGAVKRPGVFQIRGAKTLVEVLSMAEGLAEDAGDTVLVIRGAGFAARTASNAEPPANHPAEAAGAGEPGSPAAVVPAPASSQTLEVDLKRLLDSGDPGANLLVYPGDVVKVTRAGIVYVVGEVKKPGGYLLKSNENITVLQALALAEGLTRTAAKGFARIIRTEESTGKRAETPIDLGRIMAGKALDPPLRPRDIVLVPNSTARTGLYRGAEAAVSVVSGLIVFRR